MTGINDNLIFPDVPALLVTPPVNPDSIRIELIGSATFRTWAGDRSKTESKKSNRRGDFHQLCLDSVTLTVIRASVKL